MQPTAYGGPGWLPGNAKFSATSAGATTNVTSSVDVFDARHVGKNLMIETAGPYKSIFRSEITSFVDARNVVLADPCPYDMTDVAASFEVLTCNTMASSVTIDIPDMPAIDLVGRYVFLWVPGSGDNNRDLLTTRIIAQGPTTVTVAHTPAAAVAELPFILAPAEFIGVTEDEVGRGVEGSDDYQVWGQRNERSNDCGMGRLRQHHHNPRPERCIGG
ncbi:MAG: hypothetical protein H3C69_09740 [Candidatus Promineofilum sp.]|nr:hypothetical protein [Promineifilum sp.]